jgi:hypothetical protein
MAEQIAKDPSFSEMAEQLQKTVAPSPAASSASAARSPQELAAALDPQKYVSTMQQLMQNPQFVAMAERLGSALMQDPAMSAVLGGLTDPAHKEQLQARVARMKDDPSLKPILDEIESGGPAAMMKYGRISFRSWTPPPVSWFLRRRHQTDLVWFQVLERPGGAAEVRPRDGRGRPVRRRRGSRGGGRNR